MCFAYLVDVHFSHSRGNRHDRKRKTRPTQQSVEGNCSTCFIPYLAEPFGNDELNDLKQDSVEAYKLCKQCDKPKDGIVNKIRLEAKYRYKIALRQAINDEHMALDDEL